MKILLSLSFLLLMAAPKSFGQNAESDMNVKWVDLTKQLKLRSANILVFTNDLLKSKSVNNDVVINCNKLAKEFNTFIETVKNIDSGIMKTTYRKNEALTKSLWKIMISEEPLKDEVLVKKFDVFFAQMDVNEKAITKAKRLYNTSCKTNNKEDLQFTNPEPDKETKVEF